MFFLLAHLYFKYKHSLWRLARWAIIGFLGLVTCFLLLLYVGAFGPIPGKVALAKMPATLGEASLVLDRHGQTIGRLFDINRVVLTAKDSLPVHFEDVLLCTEDVRFYRHRGIDWRSMGRVIGYGVLGKRTGGGSTITQQLAKNLYPRKRYRFFATPVAKAREMIIARRLEQVFSKEELLLLYLNTVPFGEDVYGLETAAQRFFSKPASALKVEESAVLVGLLRANTALSPVRNPSQSEDRRNVVLAQMVKYGRLDANVADSLKAIPLKLDYSNPEKDNPSGYFLAQIKRQAESILEDTEVAGREGLSLTRGGLRIHTTLDLNLQQEALTGAARQLRAMQPRLHRELAANGRSRQFHQAIAKEPAAADARKAPRSLFTWDGIQHDSLTVADSLYHYLTMLHGAVFALDPTDGAVRVYVGGNHHRLLPYDLVTAQRQGASTLKPFLYAAALEQGIAQCTYLNNEPVTFAAYGDWSPENYDQTYGGKVSLPYALAHSLNLPTVNLYQHTGHEAYANLMLRLGIAAELPPYPATALGAVDVSLMQLVAGYAAFANEGHRVVPYLIDSISTPDGRVIYRHTRTEPERVLQPETAVRIAHMLQGVVREGTGTRLVSQYGLSRPWAGKTGTAQDYTDAWFVAFNGDLVAGAWVGAYHPQVHFSSGANGSGSALALPLVAPVLKAIENNKVLAEWYGTNWHQLPSELLAEFDCPGHHEPTFWEKITTRRSERRQRKGPQEPFTLKPLLDKLFNGSNGRR
jgi:penicillin-binding protein 1A